MFARRLKGLYRTRRPCVKSLLSPGGSTGPRNVNVVQYNPDHCQQSVSAFHFQLVIHSQSASGTLYSKYVGLLFHRWIICHRSGSEHTTFMHYHTWRINNFSSVWRFKKKYFFLFFAIIFGFKQYFWIYNLSLSGILHAWKSCPLGIVSDIPHVVASFPQGSWWTGLDLSFQACIWRR